MENRKIDCVNLILCIYIAIASLQGDGTFLVKIARILIVGIMLLVIIKTKEIRLNSYVKYSTIFIFISFMSIAWATSRQLAFRGSLTVLWNSICTSCVTIIVLNNKKYLINVIKVIFFCSIIYGSMIYIKYGLFVFLNDRAIQGISANDIGIRAAIGIIFAIVILSSNICKYKWIYYIGSVINILWIILSASRKSLLLVVIPLIIYFIFKSKNKFKTILNICILFILLIVIYQSIMKSDFLYNFIGHRIETMINGVLGIGSTDGSTMFRLELIEWGVQWFKEQPILGYGMDNYRYLLGFKNTWAGASGTYAHNNFIELAVNVGIVGSVIYYYIYYKIIYKLMKKLKVRNKTDIFILGFIIALLINEYGLVTYSSKYIQVVIAICWCITQYVFKDGKFETG